MNQVNETTNRPLVLFSGGLDSTVLLFTALLNNASVSVLCCNLKGQDGKNKIEKQARERIFDLIHRLREKYPGRYGDISYIDEVEISGTIYNNKARLPQKVGFLAQALVCMTDKTTEIQIGVVSGDSDSSHVDKYRNLWKAMQDASLVKEPISLEFPFLYTLKEELLRSMVENVPGGAQALKLISWCEDPHRDKPCGRCASCTTMAKTYGYIKEYNPSLFAKFKNQRQINQFLLKHKNRHSQITD